LNPKFSHASYSKYLGEKHFVENEEELLSDLISFGKKQSDKGVVFCTGDGYALFVQKHFDKLFPYFLLPLSEYDSLENILDKSKVLDIGKKAGFSVPEHSKLSDDEVFDINFPVFLKPLNSVVGGKYDMGMAKTKKDLKNIRGNLLDKYGDMEVETFIPGPISNQFEVHSYLTSKNEPLIAGMLQYQNDFTKNGFEDLTGWSEITVDYPELVQPSNNLTSLLRFKGPLDINLKRSSKDNKFYFNEVNLRSSANLMIDTKFGLNLPAIIYSDLVGKDFSHLVDRELQVGKYWISDRRIIQYFKEDKPLDLDLLENLVKDDNVHSYFDLEDPLPFYMSLVQGELGNLTVEVKID